MERACDFADWQNLKANNSIKWSSYVWNMQITTGKVKRCFLYLITVIHNFFSLLDADLFYPLKDSSIYFIHWSNVICERRKCYWEMMCMGVYISISDECFGLLGSFHCEYGILLRKMWEESHLEILDWSPGVSICSSPHLPSRRFDMSGWKPNFGKYSDKLNCFWSCKEKYSSKDSLCEKEIFSLLGHWKFLFVAKYKIGALELNVFVFIAIIFRNT